MEKHLYELGRQAAQCTGTHGAPPDRCLKRAWAALHIEIRHLPPEGGGSRDRWLRDSLYILNGWQTRLRHLPGGTMWQGVQKLCDGCRGHIDEAALEAFYRGFETGYSIRERELELLPQLLAGALICSLARREGDAGAILTSLGWLWREDFAPIRRSLSPVERAYLEDPVYAAMAPESRDGYRSMTARAARRQHVTEEKLAGRLLERARERGCHVGNLLYETSPADPRWYALGQGVFAALAALWIACLTESLWLGAAVLLPMWELGTRAWRHFAEKLAVPSALPRMALEEGIPPEGRTLCAISTLVPDIEAAGELCTALEDYALLNRDAGDNLYFAILADRPQADAPRIPEDEAVEAALQTGIRALNRQYGDRFSLYLRPRTWSEDVGAYTGRERKRGAIEGLMRLLRGKKTEVFCGEGTVPEAVQYLLTLDGDTRPTCGSIKTLAATALHPTMRAKTEGGRVVSGYGVFQPRVTVSLSGAARTVFTRIFYGPGGMEYYGAGRGEVYQRLFHAGSFTGKGLMDVDAYLEVLEGAFPPERVLSHDLLEGEYLRTASVSGAVMTEGCPAGLPGEYARLHRWTRGDWQTVPWLWRSSPITALGKWKILENLRRSLTPSAVLLCVFLGFLAHRQWLAAVMLLLWGWQRLPGQVTWGYGGRPGETARRWMLGVWRVLLLPAEAWVTLSGAATALWRMLVSGKKLLQWVTAAQSDKTGVGATLRSLLPCVIAGGSLLLWETSPLGWTLGIVWCCTPVLALAMEHRQEKPRVSREDRQYLLACAGDMWQYFQETTSAEDHWLPPDHVQEHPMGGIAHRISPTNMAFGLLAPVCARRLGLCSQSAAVESVRRQLVSLRQLERYRGHFYNWYDTRSMMPLNPKTVSTVDSGNLRLGLLALAGWLRETGEASLRDWALELEKEMTMDWLYDPRRKLLRLGWDCGKNVPAGGWYDLLASEARSASFLAVAGGEVPLRHWHALGRRMLRVGRYAALASWTGTMFEYFMPSLFLPECPGSLLGESRGVCLYAQKQRTGSKPWGISECAYYAFDRLLGYRYKASGVQAMALREGMDRELVLAPYASFLALEESPREVCRNLRRLEHMGGTGKYGFYDAIDCTPSRTGGECAVVRTWMVHHIGMSLCAVENLLDDGSLRRWTAENPSVRAYRELLEETPAEADNAGGRQEKRAVPGGFPNAPDYRGQTVPVLAQRPMCSILSNGAYTVIFTATGASRSCIAGLDVTNFDHIPMGEGCGFRAWLRTVQGIRPIAPLRETVPGMTVSAFLSGGVCAVRGKQNGLETVFSTALPAAEPGEQRTVELCAEREVTGEIFLALEPVLMPEREYRAHPAFARLMLQWEKTEDGALIRRRSREGERDTCLAVVCDTPCTVFPERDRNGEYGMPPAPGCMPDACVTLKIPVGLRPGVPLRIRVALAASRDGQAALQSARRILGGTVGRFSFPQWQAARLGMGQREYSAAMENLSDILYQPGRLTHALPPAGPELWPVGVSGDYPILCAWCRTVEEAAKGEMLLRRHALYAACGIETELLLLTGDGAAYGTPISAELIRYMGEIGQEQCLGRPGGVFLADGESPEGKRLLPLTQAPSPAMPLPPPVPRRVGTEKRPYTVEYLPDGSCVLTVNGILPREVWCDVLASETCGYLAADTGMGHFWWQSAREGQITPWVNTPSGTRGGETLTLETPEGTVSLFAAEDGFPCRVTFARGYTMWEKDIGTVRSVVTAFVVSEGIGRVLEITLEGLQEGTVFWNAALTMGSGREEAAVETDYESGTFTAANHASALPPFHAAFAPLPAAGTGLWESAARGETDGVFGGGVPACAAFRFAARHIVIAAGCVPGETLRELTEHPDTALERTKAWWREKTERIRLQTGNAAMDRFLGGWGLYQVLASRLLGRTGFYQCSGAYGFRDQLQDVCALIPFEPDLVHAHLVRAASRQFEEGDVLHWWHETKDGARGVRTRVSDDLLWLPYALCRWTAETGDRTIWEEAAPFLTAPPLKEEEKERYTLYAPGASGTVLEHALRACRTVISRGKGPHALLKMGSGDWNDGMNRAGGESVWLTWFAALVFGRMAEVLYNLGEEKEAERLQAEREALLAAAERTWQGDRYLRGYWQDGTPMEQLDSIAQSFAVFAGADRARCRKAMDTCLRELWDEESHTVALIRPPFDGGRDPGYLRAYAPGCRENGGQYTHGAVWLSLALGRLGRTKEAQALLCALLPGEHEDYRAEPFVLAGDVLTAQEFAGRAGWSWYTGSAGWFLQTAREIFSEKQGNSQ